MMRSRPSVPAIHRARWLLASFLIVLEAVGSSACALLEGSRGFNPATAALAVTETAPPRAPVAGAPLEERRADVQARPPEMVEYRIGEEDELAISVYGDSELANTQTVRPGGNIAFPLIGDIKASDLTPDQLRKTIEERISRYRRDPQVTVLVLKYNSKKVVVLGEVKTPALLRLGSDINLLEGIARAGGLTEDADLQGALLIRDGQAQPVNFDKLLRRGDFSHNAILRPNDVVLIPSIKDKKVFVLGEVNRPVAVPLRPGATLIESISMAGGFTPDAKTKTVLVVRGGLGDPTLLTVDVDSLTRNGQVAQNVALQPGDIVYVPRTFVADVAKFFRTLTTILTPLVLAQSGIVLGPAMEAVLTGHRATTTSIQPVVIGR